MLGVASGAMIDFESSPRPAAYSKFRSALCCLKRCLSQLQTQMERVEPALFENPEGDYSGLGGPRVNRESVRLITKSIPDA